MNERAIVLCSMVVAVFINSVVVFDILHCMLNKALNQYARKTAQEAVKYDVKGYSRENFTKRFFKRYKFFLKEDRSVAVLIVFAIIYTAVMCFLNLLILYVAKHPELNDGLTSLLLIIMIIFVIIHNNRSITLNGLLLNTLFFPMCAHVIIYIIVCVVSASNSKFILAITLVTTFIIDTIVMCGITTLISKYLEYQILRLHQNIVYKRKKIYYRKID